MHFFFLAFAEAANRCPPFRSGRAAHLPTVSSRALRLLSGQNGRDTRDSSVRHVPPTRLSHPTQSTRARGARASASSLVERIWHCKADIKQPPEPEKRGEQLCLGAPNVPGVPTVRLPMWDAVAAGRSSSSKPSVRPDDDKGEIRSFCVYMTDMRLEAHSCTRTRG
jgi:hypothetical protein